jgi:hypothetical protein
MTWLGKLLNLSLAALLKHGGMKCKARAFSIIVEVPDGQAAFQTLCDIFAVPMPANPIADEPIEAAADLGPHFTLLSASGQRVARGDFFHATFLRSWIQNIAKCRLVDISTDLGETLLALSTK